MGFDEDALKAFLVNLPQRLEFNKHLSVRQNLFKALYYCATDRGLYLPMLYPNISQKEIDELENLEFPVVVENQKKVFFNYKSKKESYTHPPNRACTRPFKKGEPVYRCEQCGYDDTCVLCVHCFNEDDHKDHDVYMYLSQGGGGICDCGDPEAFVNSLNCKCQISDDDTEDSEVWDNMSESLRSTIKVCLDYILDVSNFSVQTLPFIYQHINKGTTLTSEILSNYSSLPRGRYGGAADVNSSDLWYLIIWNDEHHDFHEAISAIVAATGLDQASARDIADQVHLRGNSILRRASKYTDLLEPQVAALKDGLVTTIMSARDYMREIIVRYIFNWLDDIVEFSGNSGFRNLSSSILGELLLEPFQFSKVFPEEFIESFSINHKRRCFENGLPIEGELFNYGLTTVSKNWKLEYLSKSAHEILESDPNNDILHNSRIQFLLSFEIRFPSTVRKKLSSILIPPVIEDFDKKGIFVQQFVSIYPQLFTILALNDREEHLNSLHDIATQIFTCPRSVLLIISNNQIGLILGPVVQIIEEHSAKWNYESGYPNFVDIAHGRPHTYKSIKKAVTRGIQDIAYIVDKKLGKEDLQSFLKTENLIMMLLFLRNFQGYWPIERKYGDHVERELLDFVVHIEYSLPVLNIVKSISTCTVDDKQLLSKSIELVSGFLNLRKVKKNAPGIAEFRVSKDAVSFINPINSLLSYLLLYQSLGYNDVSSLPKPFMNISDISLRSIVLGAQVRIGFWIRNGMSVSRTATLYSESILCESTFFRDMHLNQIACILDDPRVSLYNFLDRWELLGWFLNEVLYDKTIYDDRFSSIAERFIIFIYNLITDRLNFCDISGDEKSTIKARRSICYALSDEPKTFLSLKLSIDDEITKLQNFDSLLKECADYRAPSGLMDSGIYTLKEDLLEGLDPFNLQLDSNESQVVMESILKRIAKKNNIKEEEAVLMPNLVKCNIPEIDNNISRFAKTKDFAKLVYKFLQVVIDNQDESYIMQLLHLIHIIIVDDEQINGPNYLCENFVNIPICDLLLVIVESKMSKNIVSKADFLVDLFISKDKTILDSLTDSFGEEYMNSYKKRKMGKVKSDAELKKKIAKDRKTKIMKKFAKQRDKFLANNMDMSSKENEENDDQNDHSLQLRTCVLCGEKESLNSSFGLLGSKTRASTFWKVPSDSNEYTSLSFGDLDFQLSPNDGNSVSGKGYNHFIRNSGILQNIEAPVITTCGHCMHFTCYKRASNGLKFFPCPLCHNLHDLFIPTFLPPSTGGGLGLDDINKKLIHNKYNQLTSALCESKCDTLFDNFMNANYSKTDESEFRKLVLPLFEELLPQLLSTLSLLGNKTYFHYLQTLSTIIADTIRMNEIATRLDGKESLGSFLTQFNQSNKSLVRSLIQCRLLLFRYSRNLTLAGPDLKIQIEKFWESDKLLDGVFNEVIVLFFQTDESFFSLARFGYIKLITITIYSILQNCSLDNNYYHCLSKETLKLDEAVIDDFRGLINVFLDHIDLTNFNLSNNDFVRTIYYSVERILLPFLRQLIIFENILTSKDFGDNDFVDLEKFDTLEDEIRKEARLDSSLPLTNLLGLPSFDRIVNALYKRTNDDFTFEYNIFDIVLNAKIPKFLELGILTLQYPSIVKLIDLPRQYSSWTADLNKKTLKGTYDYIVCLHCGTRIKFTKMYSHMNSCSNQTNVFYHPRLNNLKLCTYIGHSPFSIVIPAPYLTEHGEIKKPSVSGKATLNEYRYNYLNKLWLNQGLHGFITRALFGSRQPQNDIEEFFDNDLDDVDEDEDDVDVEFIYEDNAPFVW